MSRSHDSTGMAVQHEIAHRYLETLMQVGTYPADEVHARLLRDVYTAARAGDEVGAVLAARFLADMHDEHPADSAKIEADVLKATRP